jgi:hypothetical protein
VHGGAVQSRKGAGRWQPQPLEPLLAYALDGDVWMYLRGHGIRRPSPSTKEEERPTVQVKLRLEPKDAERLDKLATEAETSKSALVTRWIRRG